MLGGFIESLSMLTARQTAFPISSLPMSASVSVPMHILHHHLCTSRCPQHHPSLKCAQLQPCRERGGAGANVPNSFSSHKQHKGERGERGEGRREERHFFIQHLEQQLAGLWLCSYPLPWVTLGGKGCDCPAKGFFPSFLGLAVTVGADLMSRAASQCTVSDQCNSGTP